MRSVSAEIIGPLLTKQPVNRSWPTSILRGVPSYFLGASVAVGLAMMIGQRMWEVLAVAALPLYCAFRAYRAFVARLDEAHRRREVIDALDHGMSVVNSDGLVTLWNDALERILDCPSRRVLGRPLEKAMPAVGKTELPRMITDVIATGTPRTLAHLVLPTVAGGRTLRVRIPAVAGGVTLLWDDITDRTREEHALKRSEERLALAADGANDGLWEWDLRTRSSTFESMAGDARPRRAPAASGACGMDRSCPRGGSHRAESRARRASIRQDRPFEHTHRIRHEDGTTGGSSAAASPCAGRRPPLRIAGSLTDTTEQASRRSPSERRLPRSADRAWQPRRVRRRARPPSRRVQAAALKRRLRRALSRSRSLQDRQRQPWPPGRRRAADRGLAPARVLPPRGRRAGAARRRRVRDPPERLGDDDQANAIAGRIQDALSTPFSIGGREVFTSASIGIAFGPAHYANPDEMMRDADTAMYHAKSRGKARHEVFDADMHARVLDRLEPRERPAPRGRRQRLRGPLSADRAAGSGMCVGFESLVRWTRNGDPVSPADFIPIAEELG